MAYRPYFSSFCQRFIVAALIGVVALLPLQAGAASVSNAAPVNFTAKAAADDIRAVVLSWEAAPDSTAAVYRLDRSTDRQEWLPVAVSIQETAYRDEGLAPGVHYYYRLKALDAAENASELVFADASTGATLAAQASSEHRFRSSDGLATATVRLGDLPEGAACVVELAEQSVSGDLILVAGSYALVCHGKDGAVLADRQPPVAWELQLGDRMKGLTNPEVRNYIESGRGIVMAEAQYDKRAHTVTMTAPATAKLAVLAARPDLTWVNYVVVGGLVLMALIIIAMVPMQMAHKRNYRDYLRSKYYNL